MNSELMKTAWPALINQWPAFKYGSKQSRARTRDQFFLSIRVSINVAFLDEASIGLRFRLKL